MALLSRGFWFIRTAAGSTAAIDRVSLREVISMDNSVGRSLAAAAADGSRCCVFCDELAFRDGQTTLTKLHLRRVYTYEAANRFGCTVHCPSQHALARRRAQID